MRWIDDPLSGNEAAFAGFAYWTIFFGAAFGMIGDVSVGSIVASPITEIFDALLGWAARSFFVLLAGAIPAFLVLHAWWHFVDWVKQARIRRQP